ncbi:MAG: hypothetical protein LUE86_13985, partial [Clostridiales bacterium]|nr:hypothetical protein [Clostridiales bacterium]
HKIEKKRNIKGKGSHMFRKKKRHSGFYIRVPECAPVSHRNCHICQNVCDGEEDLRVGFFYHPEKQSENTRKKQKTK